MNPFLARYLPWLIAILALIGIGWWGGWHFGAGHWKSQYDALQAQGWKQQATAEQTARHTVEGQLATLKTNLANNQSTLDALHVQNAAITADRDHALDLVHRMFAEAARSSAPRDPLPAPGDRPGTPEAGRAGSDDSLAQEVRDVADECTRNANHLDSLIAELRPQL